MASAMAMYQMFWLADIPQPPSQLQLQRNRREACAIASGRIDFRLHIGAFCQNFIGLVPPATLVKVQPG